MTQPNIHSSRIPYLDLLRVLACFMVIMVHSGEFFYISSSGGIIREHEFWVNLYGSFLRICVPIFVVISGYLILPIKESPSVFYKKRFTRILFPFLFWSIMYAVVPFIYRVYNSEVMWYNVAHLFVNFQGSAGHLWFVYMLIGLYLFIPFISPWVDIASHKQKQLFLLLWSITLFMPFIKRIFPELWGEVYWNQFHSLFYFSGYIGYLVLGNYLKEVNISLGKSLSLGICLIGAGYLLTYIGFAYNMPTAKTLAELELTWSFCTINVAMMTIGFILIFKHIKISSPTFLSWIGQMSNLSYGVYLTHILVLNEVYKLVSPHFSSPAVTIPIVAIATFSITFSLIRLLAYLPKSKYLVG